GILKTAIANTDRTISGMQVLVLGYGRVGQAICRLLLACGADVTAFTPSDKEIAWAQIHCIRAVPLSELASFLAFAQTIINTIPAPVLGPEELDQVAKDVLIIDIATGGGVDFKHAEKRELSALLLKGIPGVDAPVSAAQYIEESIFHTLSQKK
ncbi:MAG: NAD(P)-dependent oxidoreductase, partial [Bacillota bacterium]